MWGGWDGDGIVMRCDGPRPRHDTVGTGSSLCVWFGHSAGLRVAGSMTICAQVRSASQICRPTRPPARPSGRQAAPWLGEEGATSSSGGPRRPPPPPNTPAAPRASYSARGRRPRVPLHCRFRNRGTEYVSDSGMKWMRGRTKRECDRALRSASPRSLVLVISDGPPQLGGVGKLQLRLTCAPPCC